MSSDRNKMKFIAHACVLLFIVAGLSPGVMAKKPTIHPAPNWNVIEDGVFLIHFGDELRIECQGEGRLEFSTQKITGDIQQSQHKIIIDPDSGTYTFIRKHTIPEDTGWYACAEMDIVIQNDEQTTKHPIENISWIYVYVNSSNPFAVMHEFDFPTIYALAGGTAVVPCRPSSPRLPVILLKNGMPEPVGPNVTYDPKIGFTMSYVDGGDDQQSVECKVDGIDTDFNPTYTWSVRTADRLAASDVKTDKWLQVARGENLTLHCHITMYKGATVKLRWESPNNSVASQEHRSSSRWDPIVLSDEKETHKLSLTITKVRELDAGNYTCIATGSLDKVKSSTNVKIIDPSKPFINYNVTGNNNSIVGYRNGEAIWMIYINTYPPANLTWYKNGTLIGNVGSDNSSKYSREIDATTYVYRISSLNINDNGNYAIRISTSIETEVIPLQLTVEVEPVNVIHNHLRFYKPGDIAVLSCNATGSPRPSVSWTFSEWSPEGNEGNTSLSNFASPPENGGAFSAVSHLEMPISSMGNLTCSACNKVGCSNTTEPIFVSDVDGFFGIDGQKSVIEGDNLTLICAASRFNYTNVIGWILKNSTNPGSNGRMNAVNDSTKFTWQSKLDIRDVKLSDAGTYSCQAESKAGHNDTTNHTLVVVESLKASFKYTNLNNKDMDVDPHTEKDTARNLTCLAQGMPPPKVMWYKNGTPLQTRGEYRLSSDGSTLFISVFVPGRGGNYSCIAKNRLNSVERYVNIIVKEMSNSTTIWISLICVLIVIIIIVITYMGIKVHRERVLRKELLDAGLTHFEEGALECLNPDLTVDDQAELLPYDKKWEFPRELLKLGKQLGSGAFGVVMKAEARGIVVEGEVTTVAVKMVRRSADPSYMKALSSELKIMIHLGQHLNVVNLLGACTKTILTKRELYVIVEYCRFGNLHNYLQRHRDTFVDQIDPVTKKIDSNIGMELLTRTASVGSQNKSRYGAFSFSRSISGISYDSNSGNELIDYRTGTEFGDISMSPGGGVLSNNSVQPGWRSNYRGDYRDQNLKPICTQDLLCWTWQVALGMEYLSARKVLHGDLAARNILLADDNIVKICDFGLAKNMYKDNNYKKKGDGPLPIKWMAVESIRDRIFSTQSDVWSFGIVLWEFFTLARTPYPGMEAEKQYDRLIEGYRMEKPEYATDEIYEFMLHCWRAKPSLRPSFPELAEKIGTLLNEGVKMHYLELNTPYMDMNSMAKQNGQNDYLTMMSAPNHDYPGSPDPTSDEPPNSAYLSMSPVNKTCESGIFSPRSVLEESHFTFPPPSQSAPKNPDSEDCIESVPMLLPTEPYVKPVDVQQKRAEFLNQSREQTSIDSGYSNFTPTPNLFNSNNHSSDVVKESDQTLNAENLLKNNNKLTPPTISGPDNYVNMPQQKTDLLKDTMDSYSNPSYVIMTKPEGNRQLA